MIAPLVSACPRGPETACDSTAQCPDGFTCLESICLRAEPVDGSTPQLDAGPRCEAGRCADSGLPCQGTPLWWDPSFSSRRQLTITERASGILESGYSVSFLLEELGPVELRQDRNDLRVVWHSAESTSELSRHVVEGAMTSARIWFKTQAPIEESDQSYFVYYTNPQASPAPARWSNGMDPTSESEVYLAADDFEGYPLNTLPPSWEGSNEFAIREADGAGQTLHAASQSRGSRFAFAGSAGWRDISLSARVRIDRLEGWWYGLFARASGTGPVEVLWFGRTADPRLGIYICMLPDATHVTTEVYCPSQGQLSDTVEDLAWHSYELRLLGQRVIALLDGDAVYDDTPLAAFPDQGRIGIHGGATIPEDPSSNAEAYWDDVVVRRYVEPEPEVILGVEERCD